MSKTYQTNTKVKWDWAQGTAEGYTREIYRDKVTKDLGGTEVTRNASDENPAYLIEQEDGSKVLKLHSEIRKS